MPFSLSDTDSCGTALSPLHHLVICFPPHSSLETTPPYIQSSHSFPMPPRNTSLSPASSLPRLSPQRPFHKSAGYSAPLLPVHYRPVSFAHPYTCPSPGQNISALSLFPPQSLSVSLRLPDALAA